MGNDSAEASRLEALRLRIETLQKEAQETAQEGGTYAGISVKRIESGIDMVRTLLTDCLDPADFIEVSPDEDFTAILPYSRGEITIFRRQSSEKDPVKYRPIGRILKNDVEALVYLDECGGCEPLTFRLEHVEDGWCVVGRSDRKMDMGMSRRHFALKFKDTGAGFKISLKDLRSTNGTYAKVEVPTDFKLLAGGENGEAALLHHFIAGKTDAAERSRNEDSIYMDDDGYLAVSDGLGGHGQGDVASKAVVKKFRECAQKGHTLGEMVTHLVSQLSGIFPNVVSQFAPGATLAAARFYRMEGGQKFVEILNIGDSSVMIISRDGEIKFCSTEQSPVGMALKRGEMSEQEVMQSSSKSMVTSYLSAFDQTLGIPEHMTLQVNPRDFVLLCSDGVTDCVFRQELAKLIAQNRDRRKLEIVQKIFDLAKSRHNLKTFNVQIDGLEVPIKIPYEHGTRDNISLVLMEVPSR